MSQAREVIERLWDAPLALVWELWTTPEGFASWHGPEGFRTDVVRLELRAGGALEYTMTATDPQKIAWMESQGRPVSWPARAMFTEVVPQTRLAFELYMPMGSSEAVMTHTIAFEETDAGVRMVFTLEAAADSMLRGAAGGYVSSMKRLEAALAQAQG